MGAAAYNRGTRRIAADADQVLVALHRRADRQALKDEIERLRARAAKLEHDLARARRCIAELRRSKEERLAEARADAAGYQSSISQLCRIAFPQEHKADDTDWDALGREHEEWLRLSRAIEPRKDGGQ